MFCCGQIWMKDSICPWRSMQRLIRCVYARMKNQHYTNITLNKQYPKLIIKFDNKLGEERKKIK